MNHALMQKTQQQTMFSAFGSTDASSRPFNEARSQYSHCVTTQDSLSESFELIKVLRSHQRSGRWTVLIAPQNIPDKALLSCCSVDMGRVLVVHVKQIGSVLATIENALSQATCSAVVTWGDSIPSVKMRELDKLAHKAHCHLYTFSRGQGWTVDVGQQH